LPPVPVLAIAPPASSPLGEVAGTLVNPVIAAVDPAEPVLRYVDLSTTHIAEARKLTLPDWARPIIRGPGGAPLLYSGVRAGVPIAVLAFDPRKSDLPLQVGFPILLSNLVGELLGGSSAPVGSIAPGSPVQLAIPAGATGLRVTRPDGSTTDLVPGTAGATAVTYSGTQSLGVYAATPLGLTGTGPAPSASGPPASASPSSATGASTVGRPPARDELWTVIVLAALALLLLEYAVYQRDTLARWRRALASRLVGIRPASRGSHGGGSRPTVGRPT